MKPLRVVVLTVTVIVAILLVTASYYYLVVSANSVTVTIAANDGHQGDSVSYTPTSFTVKEGQHVTIVLVNHGSQSHTLQIFVLGVDTGIVQAGATAMVVFGPHKVGVFSFGEGPLVGPVAIVRQNGIVGNVTVLPP